jgi:mannosyltransferase
MGPGIAIRRPALIAAALALLTALSLAIRTSGLRSGYWIDEGIAVGIASHPLTDIPRALVQDGSPPLYYLLLHVWMEIAGTGEAATRSLSLLFALLAVPVSFVAGSAAFDRRTGALAAAGAAGCPFLTYYAQETRMYSLVAVLSTAACASFVLAFVRGRQKHVPLLGLWLVLLLYTHNWGLFLAGGMALAWLALRRRNLVETKPGALLAAGVALAYLPWLPTVLSQALHTAAPWSNRPGALQLLAIPGGLFGYVAAPLLGLALIAAVRRRPQLDQGIKSLLIIAAATTLAAWLSSQLQPAWSTRYLAVLLGPLLLALAAVLSKGARWTAPALAVIGAIWLFTGNPPAKSNVRTVAHRVAPEIRAGDLVVSTQPEQVPVLYRYLPQGVVYLTPLGHVVDPRLTDWRAGLKRLRAGHADDTLMPWIDGLAAGQRILLVTPADASGSAPWDRAVRTRTREWRTALNHDPSLRPLGKPHHAQLNGRRSPVRAQLYVKL